MSPPTFGTVIPEVHELWALAAAIPEGLYPEKMLPVPEGLPRPGWFPAETGLWANSQNQLPTAMPQGGVMAIGHNWGDEVRYDLVAHPTGTGAYDASGQNLTKRLEKLGLDPSKHLWLTNAYVGLRARGTGMVGTIHLRGHRDYVAACEDLLKVQLAALKPRVCLVLGQEPIRMVGQLLGQQDWVRFTGFHRLDQQQAIVLPEVELAGVRTSFVAIVHPSYASNVRYQWFEARQHEPALDELLARVSRVVLGQTPGW